MSNFNPDTFDWTELATGKSGDIRLERAWLRHAHNIFKIFCSKQHDYGPNNIAVGGVEGVIIRAGDKTARLFELFGIGKDHAKEGLNESKIDTIYDLADYMIILSMVYEGAWPIVTPREVWGKGETK